jgi:hypothetical protein
MTTTVRPSYEVAAELLELMTPSGHKQWLGRGKELPDWVDPTVIQELVDAGAVTAYEVI